MSTVKVNHPVAGEIDVPLEAFKDIESFNAYLLENAPDKGYGTLEVMGSQFKSGITDSIRGISSFFTDEEQLTDQEVQDRYLKEFEDRLELEQNPVAAWTGLIAGSVVDPVALPVAFLKPLKVASTVGTYVLKGASQGAFGGAVSETFEEFGDSRLVNVAGGAVLGGALGGGVGVIAKKLSRTDANAEALANISTDAEKSIDEVATDIAKAEGADVQVVKQQIKDNDEMMPDFLPQKEARDLAIWEVRSELEQNIPYILTKSEETKTQGQLQQANQSLSLKQTEVDNMDKALSGRQGKARKRLEAMRDKAARELEEFRSYRDELANKLDRHKLGVASEADIAAINKGNIPKQHKKRIDADVKANEEARANYKQRVKEQRLIKETETPNEKLESQQAKQDAELQRQEQAAEEELPTGLDDPNTSASAAKTRAAAVYNPEAVEGVDTAALTRAETTTNLKDVEPARDRGFEGGMTENQRKRQTLRQEASAEQMAKLLPTVKGKFSVENVARAAERLRSDIGKEGDYDTLMDYLQARVDELKKTGGNFSAVEREMLEPIFAEAERRLIKVGKTIRALSRQGNLDSYEGLKAAQDLQFYNYISDIDLASASAASAALRQYRYVKNLRKHHAGQVAQGKPVKNVFSDINGRSIC